MALGRVMTVGGALGLLLALVMPWYGERTTVDITGSDVETYTAFQQFGAVDIALLAMAILVIVAIALGPWVARHVAYLLTAERHQGELYTALLVLTAALVALTLVLVKVAGPVPEDDFVLRYGARFAVLCAGVTLVGALVYVWAAIEHVLAALRGAA